MGFYMMEYTVDSNVPLRAKDSGRGGAESIYPFREMGVGDSFFFTGKRHRVSSAAQAYGVRFNMKFATRKEGDGFRCWRVK